jgi:predicted negative regulator of RcsB-dependent stress response
VLAAEILGRRDEARRWLGNAQNSPWFDVARALIDQEFVRAADSLDSVGAARSGALARLRAAEELVKAGRQAEADDQLQRALSFFRSVGATRFAREGEALLAASA